MTSKEIQQLISFISKSELDEVKIETEEFKISVKKNASPQYVSAPQAVQQQLPQPAQAQETNEASPVSSEPAADDQSKYLEVRAPMIGTFYRSSNPESGPFVNVGDSIKSGETVCIIEAMKLFNDIESDISGKIVKVLVEDASPVEYDQPLFLVDPS